MVVHQSRKDPITFDPIAINEKAPTNAMENTVYITELEIREIFIIFFSFFLPAILKSRNRRHYWVNGNPGRDLRLAMDRQ